jgi:hypothetical protein
LKRTPEIEAKLKEQRQREVEERREYAMLGKLTDPQQEQRLSQKPLLPISGVLAFSARCGQVLG